MNFGDARLPESFWARAIPEPNSGCWIWLGRLVNGYGYRSHNIRIHRDVYKRLVGDPGALTLDHLCAVRCCFNPSHLEPVTLLENIQRMAARRRARGWHRRRIPDDHREPALPRTTCQRGLHPVADGRCKVCRRLANARKRRRQAARQRAHPVWRLAVALRYLVRAINVKRCTGYCPKGHDLSVMGRNRKSTCRACQAGKPPGIAVVPMRTRNPKGGRPTWVPTPDVGYRSPT